MASKYELVREEHARRIRHVSRERQIKEAKGDWEAAEEELDLGRPVEGKGPVGRRMVGAWRCMATCWRAAMACHSEVRCENSCVFEA